MRVTSFFSFFDIVFHPIRDTFYCKLHWLNVSKLLSWRCVLCVSVCPSPIRLFVYACVRKLCLQKTSPQKLLTGFLPNFTGMFLRWSSFKFTQTQLCSMKNSGCHGNQSKKPLKIFSQTTNWIALLFCSNVPQIEVYRIP